VYGYPRNEAEAVKELNSLLHDFQFIVELANTAEEGRKYAIILCVLCLLCVFCVINFIFFFVIGHL
jgi:hypothetical protein